MLVFSFDKFTTTQCGIDRVRYGSLEMDVCVFSGPEKTLLAFPLQREPPLASSAFYSKASDFFGLAKGLRIRDSHTAGATGDRRDSVKVGNHGRLRSNHRNPEFQPHYSSEFPESVRDEWPLDTCEIEKRVRSKISNKRIGNNGPVNERGNIF